MTNQALPRKSQQILERHLGDCQNLGLILDKYAPWQPGKRGQWDLQVMERRHKRDKLRPPTGGEAKGLWLSTICRSKRDETSSVFEYPRTDEKCTDKKLMRARQDRWLNDIRAQEGVAFTMRTRERLVVGLGAAHVLETAITLERNTGLPYIPGSAVKGIARTWGLFEVAARLKYQLTDTEYERVEEGQDFLTQLASWLMQKETCEVIKTLEENAQNYDWMTLTDEAKNYINAFQFIFGSTEFSGAVCFLDAIYYGESAPVYATDVMTPHYVQYYTNSGGSAPSEDDNPNPVSFLTVADKATFAFGITLRRNAYQSENNTLPSNDTLNIASDWLRRGLTQLGAGGKTAAGYGHFSRNSAQFIYPQEAEA